MNPYEPIATELAGLVAEKQKAYGDSFGKSGAVLGILFPDGVPPEKMHSALFITRVLDKLFRIATDADAFGESPAADIVGYGLLEVRRSRAAAEDANFTASCQALVDNQNEALVEYLKDPPPSPEDEAREGIKNLDACCKAQVDEDAWYCTRPPRHSGEHIAAGGSGGLLDRWPSTPPPLPKTCASVVGPWRCSLTDQHDGRHISDQGADGTVRWPNEAATEPLPIIPDSDVVALDENGEDPTDPFSSGYRCQLENCGVCAAQGEES